MRPLHIILSAFGPYAGEIKIPMEILGEKGLYLITGNTGAGKTTIFDAVTFALFGEASGDSRESVMLRSKYADDNTPTFVEMEFEYGREHYRIKRNPVYLRPSKRGEGFTEQKADAELEYPDGRVIAGARQVTAAVEALIGINAIQFSQIAMIAQGQFKELLLATTETRGAIFREIFKTRPYQIFQLKVKDAAADLGKQYNDLKKSIIQYIDGIDCREEDVLSLELKAMKEQKSTALLADTVSLLKRLIAGDEEKQTALLTELSLVERELGDVNQILGKARADQNAFVQMTGTKELLSKEEPKLTVKKADFDRETAKAAEREQIAARIISETEKLKRYEEKELLEKRRKTAKDSQEQLNQELLRLQKSLSDMTRKIEAAKVELGQLGETEAESLRLENQKEEIVRRERELAEIIQGIKEFQAVRGKLVAAQEECKTALAQSQAIDSRFSALEKAFLENQAGIMADRLNAGEKCPVCGSTAHPEPAAMIAGAPSEEQLNQAREEKEAAHQKAGELSRQAGERKGRAREVQKAVFEAAQRIFGEIELEAVPAEVSKQSQKLAEQKEQVLRRLREAESKKKRKKDLERQIPLGEERQKQEEAKLKEFSGQLISLQAEEKGLEEQLSELSQKLEYTTKGEAERRIQVIRAQKEKMDLDYQAAKKAFDDAYQLVSEYQTRIATLEKQLEGYVETDTKMIEEKRGTITARQQALLKENQEIGIRLKVNRQALQAIARQEEKMAEVEARWQWVKALSDTVSGKMKGKEKIELETYIQMTYFDRIIGRANLRLMVMSSGQYELRRRTSADNLTAKSGLDLDVVDHYNGTLRSVSTLSGGESFQASLALALGLSDEIQASAGGIRLDTMFIDEGFGSLDEESLEQAMKILGDLSEGNKLVGIISHVTELKERIDKQIIVKKARAGGSVAEVII